MDKNVSPSTVRGIIKKFNLRLNKNLGQNFLTDECVLDDIIRASELTKQDTVVEIGPGIGTLTSELCKNAGRVIAVEIDRSLMPVLKESLKGYDNLQLVNDDILKVDINKIAVNSAADAGASGAAAAVSGAGMKDKGIKVIANLPYYITTPIIMGLLERKSNISLMVFMVQKEVGERMVAPPGGKEYGALSVAVQYYTIPEIILNVPPESFIPPPAVVSAVIRLNVRERPAVEVKDEDVFFNVVKAAFGQRRKTLLNALYNSGYFKIGKDQIREILIKSGIDENARGETLSLLQFSGLADAFFKINC